MSTDAEEFDRIFAQPEPTSARDSVLNSIAWLIGTAAVILTLAIPAIAWRVWTWAW